MTKEEFITQCKDFGVCNCQKPSYEEYWPGGRRPHVPLARGVTKQDQRQSEQHIFEQRELICKCGNIMKVKNYNQLSHLIRDYWQEHHLTNTHG